MSVWIDGARAVSGAAPVAADAQGRPVAAVAAGSLGNAESGGDGYLSPFLGIPPKDIAAIEIYRGIGVTPPEFGGGGSLCGTIVVWTKRAMATREGP